MSARWVMRDILVQAAGTLLAALVLFLAGVFFGVISDISGVAIVTAIASLLGALTALLAPLLIKRGELAEAEAVAVHAERRVESLDEPRRTQVVAAIAAARHREVWMRLSSEEREECRKLLWGAIGRTPP